jgi:hypothetical protein
VQPHLLHSDRASTSPRLRYRSIAPVSSIFRRSSGFSGRKPRLTAHCCMSQEQRTPANCAGYGDHEGHDCVHPECHSSAAPIPARWLPIRKQCAAERRRSSPISGAFLGGCFHCHTAIVLFFALTRGLTGWLNCLMHATICVGGGQICPISDLR